MCYCVYVYLFVCVCAKNGGVDIAYADSQRLTRCQGVAASAVSSFVWGNKLQTAAQCHT